MVLPGGREALVRLCQRLVTFSFLLAVAACVRLGFDPRSGETGVLGDSAISSDRGVSIDANRGDGGKDAQAIDLGTFGSPVLLSQLSSTGTDDDPTLTGDLLELYFSTNGRAGQGGDEIWRSTRASTLDPWGAPAPVAELNSSANEETPGVARDGLTIWFASDRPGSIGDYDIWVAQRPSRNHAWGPPKVVLELSTSDTEWGPESADGLTLYLHRAGQTSVDTFIATRGSLTATWGKLSLVPGANTPDAGEFSPSSAAANRVLVFDADRPGGPGGRDIYFAVRSTTGAFDRGQLLGDLNSAADDEDPWISDDLSYIVFSSSRGGGKDLYEASRKP